MIKGKEIEIYGLRKLHLVVLKKLLGHQLQSFSAGRGVCSNCSGDSIQARNTLVRNTVFNPTKKRPLTTVSYLV